ncbi:MAG: DNA-protecting protein DprA [Coriobacteriales bacterium]|jgi:DNA processing protein|nr:DNA-protecting protein DprA [Coriobacteriales bacterium]
MSAAAVFSSIAISPFDELVAYEYLYSLDGATLKSMTQRTVLSNKLPSEVFSESTGLFQPDSVKTIEEYLESKKDRFSVAINNTPTYPNKLKASERPTPLIYYRGDIGLLEAPSVSIVGARKSSEEGLARADRLAKELVGNGIVVVSGLAAGVDTAALQSAIRSKGRVIGVIGTPIDEYYPRENKGLQDAISCEHLLISQVPFFKYARQPFKTKRYYFPERNELMAAVSDATVIVEASDTSGTLTQARACLAQGRPLFILRSCVENPHLTWPKRLLDKAPQNVFVLDSAAQIIERFNNSELACDA